MMKTVCRPAALVLLAATALLAACGKNPGVGGAAGDAMAATVKANEQVAQELKLDDPQDFEDAKRGLIAQPEGKIMAADGTTVLIDFDAFKFVNGKAPPTVNPSLWRHAILNAQIGLFKVTDGIWQVRGFDIANMTLIEGKTGFIVVDTLTARESAAAALAFARKHLGDKPVSAFVFHNVPGAEAPAELTFSIPEMRAYGGAENLAQTMHNLLPVRGAKARDALRWAEYMQQALDQLGDAEVYFGQHNWPVWGNGRIAELITKHRDVYKYTHDQTVRLANAGYAPREIADMVKLPQSLASYFGARGYYGDLRHNVKAVYQLYLGAYDGNPANLNPLPPQESAKRYLELLGGADKAVAAAQAAFDKGDFRWAAELLNHAVFGAPDSKAAKELLARTYDQMGYMAEAATWRNSYLTAAAELREGPPKKGVDRSFVIDMLYETPVERFLEAMAAGLDGPAADGKNLKVNLVVTDIKESYVLWIENAVLHHKAAAPAADANATLTLTKPIFIKMMAGTAGVKDTLMSDDLKIDGSKIDLVRFFTLIDKAPGTFAIVTR